MFLIFALFYMIATQIPINCLERKTKVYTKKVMELKEGRKPSIGGQFSRLIERSNLVIDRTLLIKEILENPNKILFFISPRRFGKSTNLNMLKEFLGKEDDLGMQNYNYRLFKYGEYYSPATSTILKLEEPMLIAHHQHLFDRYFGKYPIVFARIESLGGSTFTDIFYAFKYRIREYFLDHQYLKDRYKETATKAEPGSKQQMKATNNYETFVSYTNMNMNVSETANGLVVLCGMLHEYFNRRVILLMDNYDSLLNSIYSRLYYSKREEQKVLNFFKDFMQKTFRYPHLKKSVITGHYEVVKELTFDNITNFEVFNFLYDEIFQYFTFNIEHGCTLMQYFQLSYPLQNEAIIWYDGYKIGHNISYFDPWGLLQFVYCRVIQNNFTPTWQLSYYIKTFIKTKPIREDFRHLVEGGTVSINYTDLHFGKEQFFKLKEFIDSGNTYTVTRDITIAIYSYLCASAILTFTEYPGVTLEKTSIIELKFPNRQIVDEINTELKYYDNVEVVPSLEMKEINDQHD